MGPGPSGENCLDCYFRSYDCTTGYSYCVRNPPLAVKNRRSELPMLDNDLLDVLWCGEFSEHPVVSIMPEGSRVCHACDLPAVIQEPEGAFCCEAHMERKEVH
jgi:hypothetical protein